MTGHEICAAQNEKYMIKTNKRAIGIITKPIGKPGLIPLSNLIKVIRQISSSVVVITGAEGMNLFIKEDPAINVLEIKYTFEKNIIYKILSHVKTELRMSINIIISRKSTNILIFFLDSHSLLLPVLSAKILGKEILFALAASINNSSKTHNGILSKIFLYSEIITFKLSNRIIVYTPSLIMEWHLEKYQHKISIANEHVIDLDSFKILKKLNERDELVGYIGRFSEEKGIMNFIKSISKFSRDRSVKFAIGGDGHLLDKIEKYLCDTSLNANTELIGWISHDDLPMHLNDLKLLVIPSYSEGLPNIMLEAMACGTPVLATPVGAIPDIIRDEETGFLMEDNSPECIASNVVRALKHTDLDGIAKRARILVESEFTFDKAVERWRKVLYVL